MQSRGWHVTPLTPVEPSGRGGEERKLVTLLFADRVGSTASAAVEDPERTRAYQDRFYEAMATEIDRAGGTLEKFIGDAVVAAFGAPASQEDHAERALHAALAMLRVAEERFGESLRLRIGVNTGEVVVGPAREGGSFATGDAVNVAARLEQAAEPGQVLVGARTAAAVGEAFEFDDERVVEAKGKPSGILCRPLVRALALMRPRGLGGRRPTFVGRSSELALLKATYVRVAEDRRPHVVTIAGAPGVGKTRLVREFWNWLGAQSPEPLRRMGRCPPYGRGITYWPLAEILKEQFGLLETARQEEIRARLGDQQVLGLTLGLEVAGLPPSAAQQALHEAWIHFFSGLVAEGPVVVFVEDLQWGEDVLLDLIERLLGEVEGPLLILGTARPELVARRRLRDDERSNALLLSLEPLGRSDVEQMLASAVGALPNAVRDLVAERSEGNPLFVEELLGTLIDQRVIEPDDRGWRVHELPNDYAVPDSILALLAARIDLLGPLEKEALQSGAVIGRSFWAGAVRALMAGREPDFTVLEERDFIRRTVASTLPLEREYVIKHALTRAVAYETIPKSKRALLHAGFAEWFEQANYGWDEHVALLAHHYSQAVRLEDIDLAWGHDPDELRRLREKAVRWQRRSAELAVARGDLAETPAIVRPALELLDHLPRSPERAADELALQMLLGLSLSATKGYAAPEAGEAYARAQELCRRAGDTPQLFPVLFGLWIFYLIRGELVTARQLADRMLKRATSAGDPALLLEAKNMLGSTLYFVGELNEARKYHQAVLALYDPELHHKHAYMYGLDPGVVALANGALVAAVLGLDEESRRSSDEAIELARTFDHPYSLAFALALGAVLAQFHRDTETVAKRADEALELATAHGFPQLAAWSAALLGWVRVEQGQPLKGANAIGDAVRASEAIGAGLTLSYLRCLQAEAYLRAAATHEGLAVVDKALDDCGSSGEHLGNQSYSAFVGSCNCRSAKLARRQPRSNVGTRSPFSRMRRSSGSASMRSYAQGLNCCQSRVELAT
jgi:class 3 adenylate cyclase/predicted ATPase